MIKINPQLVEQFSLLENKASHFINDMNLYEYSDNKSNIHAFTSMPYFVFTSAFISLMSLPFTFFFHILFASAGFNLVLFLLLRHTTTGKKNKHYEGLNEVIREKIEKHSHNMQDVFPILHLFEYFYEHATFKDEHEKWCLLNRVNGLKQFLKQKDYRHVSVYILDLWDHYMDAIEPYRNDNKLLNKAHNEQVMFDEKFENYKKQANMEHLPIKEANVSPDSLQKIL